jgi:hypothetical protein
LRRRLRVGGFLGLAERLKPRGLGAGGGERGFVFGRGLGAVARLRLLALELGLGQRLLGFLRSL